MASRFIAFGTLGLACIVAAGGGAYLAVRQSQANPPTRALDQPSAAMQQPAAQGTPAGFVTTPPAAGETTASVSAPPAAPAPAESASASNGASQDGESHETARRPRPARAERRTPPADKRVAQESGQAAVPQPDPANARAGAPLAGSAGAAPQAATPQPQSVSQVPAEPQREWVEVTVPAESVLGLQIQTAVSSETARVEDRVEARVTRDVRVGDRVAVPAGSQALGSVVQVERGGKLKDRAHFAIRFNTLILPDGSRLPLTAEAVHREGSSPTNKSAARIGGATVGGAILGAILGGGKGAAIGGAIGAGGGTAAAMAGDREPATLPAGSIVNIRLMSPVTVTLER
jgi:type IV secretory pathway VirB10-like protein